MVSQAFSPASLTTTGNQRNRMLSGLYSNIVRRLVEHTRKKELERSCVRSLDSWYKLVFMDQIFLKCYWKDFPRCAAGISWGELERNTCEDKREKWETVWHLILYEKFLWLFLFTDYTFWCTYEMMKLVFLNDSLSSLNYKYSSWLRRISYKTSMVFNDGTFLR